MIKREAKFTVLFRHWLMANPPMMSCAFELKQTRKNSIPFSYVQPHQIDALMAVKHGEKGLLYKAPDDSRNIKPFDMFFLWHVGAFVVIQFPDFFSIIDVDRFINFRNGSMRKSLTSEEAKKIALRVITL